MSQSPTQRKNTRRVALRRHSLCQVIHMCAHNRRGTDRWHWLVVSGSYTAILKPHHHGRYSTSNSNCSSDCVLKHTNVHYCMIVPTLAASKLRIGHTLCTLNASCVRIPITGRGPQHQADSRHVRTHTSALTFERAQHVFVTRTRLHILARHPPPAQQSFCGTCSPSRLHQRKRGSQQRHRRRRQQRTASGSRS
jgi:hypothetical protein